MTRDPGAGPVGISGTGQSGGLEQRGASTVLKLAPFLVGQAQPWKISGLRGQRFRKVTRGCAGSTGEPRGSEERWRGPRRGPPPAPQAGPGSSPAFSPVPARTAGSCPARPCRFCVLPARTLPSSGRAPGGPGVGGGGRRGLQPGDAEAARAEAAGPRDELALVRGVSPGGSWTARPLVVRLPCALEGHWEWSSGAFPPGPRRGL